MKAVINEIFFPDSNSGVSGKFKDIDEKCRILILVFFKPLLNAGLKETKIKVAHEALWLCG